MVETKLNETKKAQKQFFVGTVISNRMNKTAVVQVERVYKHSRVKKTVRTLKKYKVHDEQELARVGDKIEFYQGRPVSKTKYMYLHRVVDKATE